MGRIDLVEPYAIRNARKAVIESMQAHGEEVIALAMYHPGIDENVPRCPNCYDPDYKQADKGSCSVCYGTSFDGGVKTMARIWAMFDDSTNLEKVERQGVWQMGNRGVQMEANPQMMEHDFLLRVKRWSHDHRPLEIAEAFSLDVVTIMSLRTGNQHVQTDADRIGQKAQAHMLDTSHVIYKVNGRLVSPDFTVPRLDGFRR